ncbi:MAG: putative RNA methyltransferase [Ktedonobacteraceae bacterium]
MSLSYLQQIVCPICATPLAATERTLTCANGHSFDLAREGYVHFLRKPLPGDTKEMLIARRDFFAQGHYRPISEAVNTSIRTNLAERGQALAEPFVICDAGCGEGYYLSRLQASLAEQHTSTTCLGLDISKEAVRMAAKRCRNAFFVVANLKERLPLADASLHVMLNIFAPRNLDEFARVLAPGGLLLVVIPAPTHLQQLRNTLHLLQIEENKQQHVIAQFTEQGQFYLEGITPVTYELFLQGNEISQLVMMTPNYWHASEETRLAMAQLTEIRTEVACVCLAFRRQ